jgi:hypothetical protein
MLERWRRIRGTIISAWEFVPRSPVPRAVHRCRERSMQARWSRYRVIFLTALNLIAPVSVRAQQTGRSPGASAASAASATQDSLLSQRERAQWEALKARDTTAFASLMGGNLVDVDLTGIKRTSPTSTARYVMGCRTTSYSLSDVRVAHYETTAVITYKAELESTCWGQKAPSPVYVMTVYERRAGAWLAVAHSETPAARW